MEEEAAELISHVQSKLIVHSSLVCETWSQRHTALCSN